MESDVKGCVDLTKPPYDYLPEQREQVEQIPVINLPGSRGSIGTPSPDTLTRDRFIKEFSQLTHDMLQLTKKKNNDYGGPVDPLKNFRRHGEYGIIVRMDDKMARLESFFKEKRALAVEDEKITDTAMDLAVYAIILIIMSRESGIR